MTTTTTIRNHTVCTVYTMSKGCREQIEKYILSNIDDVVITKNAEDTKKSIMQLPYFQNGCFTSLQATAFANYFSGRVY